MTNRKTLLARLPFPGDEAAANRKAEIIIEEIGRKYEGVIPIPSREKLASIIFEMILVLPRNDSDIENKIPPSNKSMNSLITRVETLEKFIIGNSNEIKRMGVCTRENYHESPAISEIKDFLGRLKTAARRAKEAAKKPGRPTNNFIDHACKKISRSFPDIFSDRTFTKSLGTAPGKTERVFVNPDAEFIRLVIKQIYPEATISQIKTSLGKVKV